MKIGIDLSPTGNDPAGIGQYTVSLFSELLKSEHKFYSYSTTPLMFSGSENIVIKVSDKLPFKGIRWMNRVSKDVKSKKLDLFISPSSHLFSKLLPNTLQFVHDLAPVFYPELFSRQVSIKYKRTLKYATKKAKMILTIPETVEQELIENYSIEKERIEFIYPGLNSWLLSNHKNPESVLSRYNLDFNYILTLSTLEPRKNHLNMLKAFKEFKKRTLSPLKLVVVGKKGWYYDAIFQLVDELSLTKEVVFLGYVPNQDLSPIYKKAKAFIFMSFYEGFGIPPIEALSLDIPTLVSDIPVFHEAYGEYAMYADPKDSVKIAGALVDLFDKKNEKSSQFIQTKYSWEKSAQKLLKIIDGYK